MRLAFLSAGFLCALAGGIRGQELPHSSQEYGAFAFPDPGGTRLLVVADLSRPDLLQEASCGDGRRFPVRFEKRQVELEGAQGRQGPGVFDKVAGSVFTVLQGKIEQSTDSCFLASDALRRSATWLSVMQSAGGECAPDIQRRLAASRRRPVAHCWAIAVLPADRRVVLAEFVRQDKDALACMVLLADERMLFVDYSAKYSGEGEDLWRADDNGRLSPEGHRVVFVFQRGTSYVLGLSWAGFEGRSLAVYVPDVGNRFKAVIADYWYQAAR